MNCITNQRLFKGSLAVCAQSSYLSTTAGSIPSPLFVTRRAHSTATISTLGRLSRTVAWEPRRILLERRKDPIYMSECRGTPRCELQENLVDGVRVKPTFNPYVKLTKARRYVLDNWPSRNVMDWNPHRCFVRGSRRRYNIPQDIVPYKDELGEWHPPRLSGRYKADVERQYRIHGLPWLWDKDFYKSKLHYHDHELLGPKKWYRRQFRRQQVKEAMRNMEDKVAEYRQSTHAKQKYNWLEKVVHDFAGEQTSADFLRKNEQKA